MIRTCRELAFQEILTTGSGSGSWKGVRDAANATNRANATYDPSTYGERMMVYRRDPDVLRLHIPMPLRFLEPTKLLTLYTVPAIMRLGGLEVRLPKAVRYVDGI